MQLAKAIEELTRYRKEPYSKLHPYFSEAVDLGIEALKRIKACREPKGGNPLPPLAGETGE